MACQETSRSYKTTNRQYEIMLTFMQEHGDLCAPSGRAKSRARQNELWLELTSKLNQVSTGYTKTRVKWIKVWCDWKTRTKKKVLYLTINGKNSKASLTNLESQLMAFLGWDGEIPAHDRLHNEAKQSDTELKLETAEDDMNIIWNKAHTPELDDGPTDDIPLKHFQAKKFKAEQLIKYSVDSTDSEQAESKLSHHPHKRRKQLWRKNNDTTSIFCQIFDEFSQAEQRRLDVDILRQRNEARREKKSSEQSQNNHMEILDFMEHCKKTMKSFLTIYSKK